MTKLRCWPLFGLIAWGCHVSPGERVALSFVGDVLLDSQVGKTIERGKDPFSATSTLLDADFSIGNLECPVATSGVAVDKVYTFRASPSTLPILGEHFDAVSVANNHSGDYGTEAFEETLTRLRAAGVPYFGGGRNASDAHTPLLLKKRGLTIALLGYDEFHPRSFEATAERPGVAWAEEEQIVLDIAHARAAGADVVLPFMHWGWENEATPSARQRELARVMIDAGASAVIGAHPHVTQGAELYRGKPIIYSLGNFAFDLLDRPENAVGWQLLLVVDRRGVQRFELRTVSIDEEGIPSPATSSSSQPCWARGAPVLSSCGAALPSR